MKSKNQNNWKKIVTTALVLCIVLGSVGIVAAQPSASVTPSSQEVDAGEQFTIDIDVNPGSYGVSSGELQFAFDASVMQVDDVVFGDLMASPSALAKDINNTAGTVLFAGFNMGVPPVPTAPGTFATITIIVDGDAPCGTYDLDVTSLGLMDETPQDIPGITITDGEVVVSGGAPPAEVVINEFVAQPNVTQTTEWIELYNPNAFDVPLDGWTIEDNTGSTYGSGSGDTSLDGKTVPASGYLVLNKSEGDFGFALNDPGDIIILKNGTTEVDRVTYGNWDDGNTADNAPAPGADNSTGRSPNGQDTGVDIDDFAVFTSPTPSESNGGDITGPVITFIEPPTPANNSENTTGYVNISVNVTDPSGVDNVTVVLTWDGTGHSMTEYMYAFTEGKYYCEMTDLPNGEYTYWVQANDTLGNMGMSETRVVTVNVTGAELMEGDVTLDGHVTMADAMFIAQYKAGVRDLNADQLKCADTTDEGAVSLADAMHIAQWKADPDGSLGVLFKPLWEFPADDDMLPPVDS